MPLFVAYTKRDSVTNDVFRGVGGSIHDLLGLRIAVADDEAPLVVMGVHVDAMLSFRQVLHERELAAVW